MTNLATKLAYTALTITLLGPMSYIAAFILGGKATFIAIMGVLAIILLLSSIWGEKPPLDGNGSEEV